MRTRSEFLTRMSEYGYLKYDQSVCRVTDSEPNVDPNDTIYVYKFLKQGLDITVMWDFLYPGVAVTLIGGCHNHRKEVIQIVNGTDIDKDEDE